MSVSTFATGNNNYNWDPEAYLTGNRNLGITLGGSDGKHELCKERQEQKLQDNNQDWIFELVHLNVVSQCFHPNSPYENSSRWW